jgi:preprotein translocase subunit SecB
LQLLEYVFDGVSVQPVEGYKIDPEVSPNLVFFPGKLSISAEVGIDLLAEEFKYSDYGVSLALKVGPKSDELAPYEVHVTVKGLVRMHLVQADGQAEERRVRALVNGVSLLYGAVRDQVMTITSRSVHGPFLLPSVSFADLALPKGEPVTKLAVRKPMAKRAKKLPQNSGD